MVAAQDLKSCDFGHAGSSPALGTKTNDVARSACVGLQRGLGKTKISFSGGKDF